MRWQGSLEVMASQDQKRARNRAATARRLVGELAPWKSMLFAALGFVLVNAGAQAAGPWLVGRTIDRAITQHNPPLLLQMIGVLLVVYIGGALAQRAQTRRVGMTGQYLLASLRARLFEQLQALPLAWFDKRPIGDLMSRLLSDVDTLNQLFSQGLTQLLGALLGLVGILGAMLVLNWRLALVCYAIIPAMLLMTAFFAARARAAFRKTRETVGHVTADLQEEIVGVRQAQAFNRTAVNIQKF
ncbi:MAG TPA: ABC transporter transmembrane domain-containing protein, partial [Polyangia bacterium]|nr:ABC transporter transmembrane domain-containing protein [Polyangia bacterium]